MKNRSFASRGLYVPLAALLLMTSCRKDATSANQDNSNAPAAALSDSSTATDNAYMDVTATAFTGYADNAPSVSGGKHDGSVSTMSTTTNGSQHMSCAIVTKASTDGGFTLAMDFGSGCTSADSIVRSGKITYSFNGNIISSGSTVTAAFDHYSVNGYGLAGSYTLTNASTDNGDSVTIFKTSIENGVCSFPDGAIFTYSGNKTFTTTSGVNAPFTFLYDSLSITGGSQIASSAGNTLTTTVTTPLIKNLDCRNISSGIISFVYNGNISGTFDYGNGNCDTQATIKIGLFSEMITLH